LLRRRDHRANWRGYFAQVNGQPGLQEPSPLPELKRETCRSVLTDPQCGHFAPVRFARIDCSTENVDWQSLHLYSYIGIALLPLTQL